jgi:hypothetical protein
VEDFFAMAEQSCIAARVDNFIKSVASAEYDECRTLFGSEVESKPAFEEMRKYLLDLYGHIGVVASFVEDDGQVVDCIPVDQHPAVKRWGAESASTHAFANYSS